MKVVLAIDPGAPKARDKSAHTGYFVGELSRLKRIDGGTFEIVSTNIDEGIRSVASQLKEVHDDLVAQGHEVTVVIEEYKNYDWNGAANSFSKNETSQLIGGIKTLIPGCVMQSTNSIKTGYPNKTLIELKLLEKKGNKIDYTEQVGGTISTRHERDAFRHYLMYRKHKGYINRIKR